MSELKKSAKQKSNSGRISRKSGISVRTIQRIEAGTIPKGYTLKTLAASLKVSEKDLLIFETIKEEIKVDETIIVKENDDSFNLGLVKIINLSTLPLAWLPVAHFLPPLLIMLFSKNRSQIVKQIISLQIFLAVIFPIIFMLIVLLKLGRESVMITMIFLILTNVYITLRNAYEIDKREVFVIGLNFSII
ncbi:helix-turn-helix domain-containing protein [Chryseobacterium indoltheticum]|uniref:helix-turn-helix domain-containing protein n=1 Tax=Chryseobacterium indoltheticum TaxID=254 RepID=UPI003F498930